MLADDRLVVVIPARTIARSRIASRTKINPMIASMSTMVSTRGMGMPL